MSKPMNRTHIVLVFLCCLLMHGCKTRSATEGNKINVVCTTTMIYDAIQQIFDTTLNVYALMKPGTDPHTYKASAGEVKLLKASDVILYNGLNLEGKIAQTLENLKKTNKSIAVTDFLNQDDLIFIDEKIPDPHVWFDIPLWQMAIQSVVLEIVSRYKNYFSVEQLDYISKNEENYLVELTEAHLEAIRMFEMIPQEKRILITAHDAFNYFGKAYNFQVLGLQGISTASEHGLKDIIDMINLIVENRIPAIFIESTIQEKSVKAVIEGCKSKGYSLKLGGVLYSDATGPKHLGHHTLAGAFRHNVHQIYNALKDE